MKDKEIDVQALQCWLLDEEVQFAYSHRERKRLTCDLIGTLKVTVAGVVKYRGSVPSEAVEAYNAINEKYEDPKMNFVL